MFSVIVKKKSTLKIDSKLKKLLGQRVNGVIKEFYE